MLYVFHSNFRDGSLKCFLHLALPKTCSSRSRLMQRFSVNRSCVYFSNLDENQPPAMASEEEGRGVLAPWVLKFEQKKVKSLSS